MKPPMLCPLQSAMSFDLKSLVAARMGENYELHARHLNPTLVEVQRITGFDRVYTRAEALLKKAPPHLEAIFFCNSGTEAIEGALKFARAATGRAGIVSLHSGYHGLRYGSLSVTRIPHFQEGFGPFLAEKLLGGDVR